MNREHVVSLLSSEQRNSVSKSDSENQDELIYNEKISRPQTVQQNPYISFELGGPSFLAQDYTVANVVNLLNPSMSIKVDRDNAEKLPTSSRQNVSSMNKHSTDLDVMAAEFEMQSSHEASVSQNLKLD